MGGIAFTVLLSLTYFIGISIILSYRFSLNSANLGIAVILVITISDLAGLMSDSSLIPRIEKKIINYNNLWPIIPILLLGFLLAVFFRSRFSWPSMPGWDIYTHLGVTNWIVTHHGTTNIFPSGPDSVFPYPYLFHILVSSIAIFIGIAPYSIFWAGPFFTIPLYGLLVYGVSQLLTKQRLQSFFASIISLTICGGEILLGPHYFFPSTISILLFLILLITILDFSEKGFIPWIFVCVFIFLYYTFYYYSFIITFPILLFILMRKKHLHYQLQQKFHIIFTVIFSGMIFFSMLGGAILPSGPTISLNSKLEIIKPTYPNLLLLLFLLGALIIIIKSINNIEKNSNFLIILIYTLSLIIIYFLPPSALNRTEMFFRSFIAIIASFSFLQIQNSFIPLNKVVLLINRHKIQLKIISNFFYCFVLFFLILLLIQPYSIYRKNVQYWSNISKDEYLAAEWIKENSFSGNYILTDPSTGYVLRGLTLRNSSNSFIIKGHTPSPKSSLGAYLSKPIYEFFREEDPLKSLNYFETFPKAPDFIIITTRTSSWLRQKTFDYTFCAPTSETIEPFSGMSKFSTPFFTLLKSFETVKIYRLT